MPEPGPASLPRANVLGVGVHAIDMATAVRESERLVASGGKGYVCVTGVHGVMESRLAPHLQAILNRAFLCVPDGMPMVWVGRLQGQPQMRRVYGPDYMIQMCQRSLLTGHRHFFYGGAPGVAERLRDSLLERMPWLKIVGTYTPPFESLSARQECELFQAVATARPDILWVGLSTPKQELFMARYGERLAAKLIVGVGAAFDLHAGLRSDAPAWMKSCGLQWLHRLAQEPRRLGPRYLRHNPRFVCEILGQFAAGNQLNPLVGTGPPSS
jgi:N-acetylglucosaminyldiphosphoundecaprenol N-acetyl-beta-D-mannosaminyltransferase